MVDGHTPPPSSVVVSPADLEQVCHEIWQAAAEPCALYLRGSVAAADRHPWDLDIVVVLHREVDGIQGRLQTLCEALEARFPAIPPIDLHCVGRDRVLYHEETFLTRLLLKLGGRLMMGTDVLATVWLPPFSVETADVLRRIFARWTEGRVNRLHQPMSDREYQGRTATLAKATLRTVTVPAMRREAVLLRDPHQCLAYATLHFPEFSAELSIMARRMQGEIVPPSLFIAAVRTLLAAFLA